MIKLLKITTIEWVSEKFNLQMTFIYKKKFCFLCKGILCLLNFIVKYIETFYKVFHYTQEHEVLQNFNPKMPESCAANMKMLNRQSLLNSKYD